MQDIISSPILVAGSESALPSSPQLEQFRASLFIPIKQVVIAGQSTATAYLPNAAPEVRESKLTV